MFAVFLMVLMSNFLANLVLASVDGPSVFWKYSLWGKRRAFTEGAETLSKRLAEETGGKFQLKIFYGGQLAKSRENWDGETGYVHEQYNNIVKNEKLQNPLFY